ncbi:MAG: hypothetical protein HFJ48_01585 [Clostridia bacterium]|nr:hypothetical protein [Clostridia bacterium]
MYILLIIFAILCVITTVLEIKSNRLQQKILEEIIDFCKQQNEEQLQLIKELNENNLKMQHREKLSIILLKQLNKERAKRKDIESNLEFVTNNIEDTKLKEVIVAQNK